MNIYKPPTSVIPLHINTFRGVVDKVPVDKVYLQYNGKMIFFFLNGRNNSCELQ